MLTTIQFRLSVHVRPMKWEKHIQGGIWHPGLYKIFQATRMSHNKPWWVLFFCKGCEPQENFSETKLILHLLVFHLQFCKMPSENFTSKLRLKIGILLFGALLNQISAPSLPWYWLRIDLLAPFQIFHTHFYSRLDPMRMQRKHILKHWRQCFITWQR